MSSKKYAPQMSKLVKVSPQIHAWLSTVSKGSGVSIKQLIETAISRWFDQEMLIMDMVEKRRKEQTDSVTTTYAQEDDMIVDETLIGPPSVSVVSNVALQCQINAMPPTGVNEDQS